MHQFDPQNQIEDFSSFCRANGYCTIPREVNPVHVCHWLLSKDPEEFIRTLDSTKFPTFLSHLLKHSKFPMALFITRDYIKSLSTGKPFDPIIFEMLFNVILEASRRFATDPKGVDLIRNLPDELPTDRGSIDSRFRTKVNDCFRLTLVIDIYNWLPSNIQKEDLISNLSNLITDYKKSCYQLFNLGKYKKTRILLKYISTFLTNSNIKSIDNNIGEFNESLLAEFLQTKKLGIQIRYGDMLVTDTAWSRLNLLNKEKLLRHFIKEIINEKKLIHNSFSVFDISLEDFLMYQKNFSINVVKVSAIKQFIAFLIELGTLRKIKTDTLGRLFLKLPTYTALRSRKITPNPKNFLSKKDYICLIQTAISTSKAHTRLKHAIYLGLIGFCALRKSEAMCIQVGDFDLDENGLIADLNDGYGKLNLPFFKSKGGYSPSNSDLGILVIPRLRDLINVYLKSDRMKGYDESTFILRSKPVSEKDDLFDNITNKHFSDGEWLAKLGTIGESIMEHTYSRARPLLAKYKGRISSHDLRRSINQFIKDAMVRIPPLQQMRVAQMHLRHKDNSVNDRSYTDTPSIEDYVMCIHSSLNFPWDLEELKKWEQVYSYNKSNRDWGTVNGHKKIPAPSQLESNPIMKTNNLILVPQEVLTSDIYTQKQSEKEIKLKVEVNKLKEMLKNNKNINRIAINAKISKLEYELSNNQL